MVNYKGTHRGRMDIVAEMLEAGEEGIKKTYFMYRCNLSFRQLEIYLNLLLRNDLLRKKEGLNGEGIYKITEKGYKFLKGKREIDKLLDHGLIPNSSVAPYINGETATVRTQAYK